MQPAATAAGLGLLALTAGCAAAPDEPVERPPQAYFAPESLEPRFPELDELWRGLYAQCLSCMAEPSLAFASPGSEPSLRFVYLRSFHPPLCVRITGGGRAARVTVVELAHEELARRPAAARRAAAVARATWASLRRRLDDPGLWTPRGSTAEEQLTVDGARWLLELRDGDDYRVVHRQNPEDGGPHAAFRRLCLDVLAVADVRLPADEIY